MGYGKETGATKEFIKNELGIDNSFGRVFSFVDFANVNNRFNDGNQTWDKQTLKKDESLGADVKGLKKLVDCYSHRTLIYYGQDPNNLGSVRFTDLLRIVFSDENVVTKNLQVIKHYISEADKERQPKPIQTNTRGRKFLEIRKCNFDVEMAVDAVRTINHYDTFCLFSGDADFVYLNDYLRGQGKRVIIIKGGHITAGLRKSSDLVIDAQDIKRYITRIKCKKPGL